MDASRSMSGVSRETCVVEKSLFAKRPSARAISDLFGIELFAADADDRESAHNQVLRSARPIEESGQNSVPVASRFHRLKPNASSLSRVASFPKCSPHAVCDCSFKGCFFWSNCCNSLGFATTTPRPINHHAAASAPGNVLFNARWIATAGTVEPMRVINCAARSLVSPLSMN